MALVSFDALSKGFDTLSGGFDALSGVFRKKNSCMKWVNGKSGHQGAFCSYLFRME